MNIMDEILQTAQDIEKLTDVMLGKVKEYKALAGMSAEKPKGEIWKPEIGENYWFLTDAGTVGDACYAGDDFDNEVCDCGNFYKTEAEAEYQAKVQKYTNLYRKYVEEHSEPLDWETDDEHKHYLCYDYENSQIYFECACRCRRQGAIYASSQEVLEEAISFVGKENVIKYVLGVK